MNWSAIINGTPILNLSFFVLCRKSFIDISIPKLPPKAESIRSVDSGILCLPFIAALLSNQETRSVNRLTKIR